MNSMAKTIRGMRKSIGLKLGTMSRMLHISPSRLSSLERNTAKPSGEELEAIAKLFRVPLASLKELADSQVLNKQPTVKELKERNICTSGGSEKAFIELMEHCCSKCQGDCIDGCEACGGSGWRQDELDRQKEQKSVQAR